MDQSGPKKFPKMFEYARDLHLAVSNYVHVILLNPGLSKVTGTSITALTRYYAAEKELWMIIILKTGAPATYYCDHCGFYIKEKVQHINVGKTAYASIRLLSLNRDI